MSGFVHLHCHSTWSLLDGAIPAETLPWMAAELGYEAVALTDHDALTGAVRFARACRDAGVKPIYGAELTLTDGHHVTAIARDATGYANLCRLISRAHLDHERGQPRTTFASLAERAEGLFVLSGCGRGEVPALAAAGAMPQAIEAARRWRDVIGDGYRIEVFDHRGYGASTLRDRLLGIARETGIQAVATNDVHYPTPREAATHELLHAIREIVPLSRTKALRSNSEYGFKAPHAMRELFQDAAGRDAADETLRIAEACDFDLDLGRYHFPEIPMPPGETATGALARRCYEGAHHRFDKVTGVIDVRLQHELQLIYKMGFAAYFLLVADIVRHTREVLGMRCACRGSAAGSLVCYVLGISDVDPVRYDLLFERFMNERREELPDIDVDVESHRREEVLAHILDTYGRDQTAMCCMVDTFRARMAIREVGKALGLPGQEIDLVAKAFPRVRARDIPQAIERLPELAGTNLRAGQLEQLFELCLAIDGFPRHLALHPSGVILSSPDLADRVPMQASYGGFTMLQADKDDVEELGLAKLDVLGVRMLSSISHAVGEIERAHGERVDLDRLPHDDTATYDLVKTSKTLGCFQIESPGQRELLARFQPNRFEDLIVDISLFRPGPVKSDMVSPFLERYHGFEQVRYPHPSLKPILRETNGVVVFHEQVIRVIAEVTGCSLADADYVRRHLDAERPSLPGDPGHPGERKLGQDWVKDERVHFAGVAGPITVTPPQGDVAEWFITSAIYNGFKPEQAETLWREVFSFASFGFCKSHAAAFALPTYLSAWLKAHHPAAFLAGVLTHDPGMYPRRLIVADARNFGIPILPIDVNASDRVYRVEPVGDPARPGIRLALSEVRGVSEAAIDSLLAAREEARFSSLEDLWRRTEVSQPVLENLVHVGALDGIEPRSRHELMWRVLDLSSQPKPRGGSQLGFALEEPIAEALPGLPAYTPLEETEAELEVSGIDARRHIMSLYEPLLAELGCTSARDLVSLRNNSEVWVAGVKVASQTPAIRSGQRIIFVTIDDVTGPIDVTAFERVQPRCARTIFHSWILLVRGVVRKRGGASLIHPTGDNVGLTVVVNEAFDLAELARDRKQGHSAAGCLGRQRKKQSFRGLDAGGTAAAPGRLWHASGGSAGR
ncbi:MAG: DNA polymerase III subunit alpha [Actinomycetota bacterium]|nr:DNA polymerase III subunit alpha [Actinomycetota bacterium]